MNNYQFNNLIDDLSCNREIEFKFNKNDYSITNAENHWYFFSGNDDKSIKICEFEENDILINFIEKIIIDSISLQDIFDKNLYTNLYVL